MPSAKMKQKNGTIEFYRFLFCVIIVFCHSKQLGAADSYIFPSGAICVEFFFLVSGFLMANSVSKMPPYKGALANDTLSFFKRKVAALCPNYYIAWLFGFFIYLAAHHINDLWEILKVIGNCFFELIFVNMTGLIYLRINGATWYLSSMLLAIIIIYPFLRKYFEFFSRVAAPVIAFILLGYLLKTFGHLRTGTNWLGLTYKGNIRAVAEICLGISLFPYANMLKHLSCTNFSKMIISFFEHIGYIGLIVCSSFPKATKYDFLFLFLAALSVMLSFSGQSISAKLYNNKFSFFAGRFSFSLYLSHVFYAKFLPLIFPSWTYANLFILYWILAIGTGLFVMYSSELIRRKFLLYKDSIRSIFIKMI